jgi:hypothetical protein
MFNIDKVLIQHGGRVLVDIYPYAEFLTTADTLRWTRKIIERLGFTEGKEYFKTRINNPEYNRTYLTYLFTISSASTIASYTSGKITNEERRDIVSIFRDFQLDNNEIVIKNISNKSDPSIVSLVETIKRTDEALEINRVTLANEKVRHNTAQTIDAYAKSKSFTKVKYARFVNTVKNYCLSNNINPLNTTDGKEVFDLSILNQVNKML